MRISGDYALDRWARYLLASDFPSESVDYKIMLYAGDHVDRGAPGDGIPAPIRLWRPWMTQVEEVVYRVLDDRHRDAVMWVYVGGLTPEKYAQNIKVSKRTVERWLEMSRFGVEVALKVVP